MVTCGERLIKSRSGGWEPCSCLLRHTFFFYTTSEARGFIVFWLRFRWNRLTFSLIRQEHGGDYYVSVLMPARHQGNDRAGIRKGLVVTAELGKAKRVICFFASCWSITQRADALPGEHDTSGLTWSICSPGSGSTRNHFKSMRWIRVTLWF